ncbi:hypothetical protein MSG28_014065 [Choristoneura fumiferana]|uniref:Uncharacterized protein n=1 Tax=Choristoneura fumiferana TaxID=7141 RepID=A0ACC0JFQ3_CHOFU|nr:hypothetical protein MSG28_014065 [Choristoneura fumiferana]
MVECKSYVFNGDWRNEVKKCASGGGNYHTYTFNVGNFNTVGLKYEDLNEQTEVISFGELSGHTGASDHSIPSIILQKYKDGDSYKKYYAEWGFTSTAGWATQTVQMQLTVKFMNTGQVELINYVYAYAMMSVTCAETKAYAKSLMIAVPMQQTLILRMNSGRVRNKGLPIIPTLGMRVGDRRAQFIAPPMLQPIRGPDLTVPILAALCRNQPAARASLLDGRVHHGQTTMMGKIEGKRRVGRRKKSWLRNIREWTGIACVEELFSLGHQGGATSQSRNRSKARLSYETEPPQGHQNGRTTNSVRVRMSAWGKGASLGWYDGSRAYRMCSCVFIPVYCCPFVFCIPLSNCCVKFERDKTEPKRKSKTTWCFSKKKK